MGEQTLARILGVLACAGFVWVGIGFASFALTTALAPRLGLAGAAAVTAAVLFVMPLTVAILFGRNRPTAQRARGADSALAALAALAKERPVTAMIGAALFGAAEVLLSGRRTERK